MGIFVKGKIMCDCGVNYAKWFYMPGYSDGGNPYSCDDCVISPDDKNGCSCNWNYAKEQDGLPIDSPVGIEGKDWKWVTSEQDEGMGVLSKEDGYWVNLDERGRPYPCVEYDYSKKGYPDYTWLGEKLTDLDLWFFFFKRNIKHKIKAWWKRNVVDTAPNDVEI